MFVVLVLEKDIPINEYDSLEISPRLRHVSQRRPCLLGPLSLKTRRRHRYIYMQTGNVGNKGGEEEVGGGGASDGACEYERHVDTYVDAYVQTYIHTKRRTRKHSI